MSRSSFFHAASLSAILLASAALAFGRQPAHDSADLTGKYALPGGGYLVVSTDDVGRVEGFYERDGRFGRVSGVVEADTLSATWTQENGATACQTPVDGARYWGKMTLTRDADGVVSIAWGACDAPPTAR
ncbi:MAG: hypothetical protein KDC27_18905 [Acidobacteria bacterium]|nr:hypothetical protein [Acidobacteriota bacterium]